MKITLSTEKYGYLITAENGKDIFIQSDWDFPGIASTFGWAPCHNCTDGTVNCKECGNTASYLINEAMDYLEEHIGDTVNDPGYFKDV